MARGDVAAAAGHALRVLSAAAGGLLGVLLVAVGAWMAWPPAGPMAAGGLIVADRVIGRVLDRRTGQGIE